MSLVSPFSGTWRPVRGRQGSGPRWGLHAGPPEEFQPDFLGHGAVASRKCAVWNVREELKEYCGFARVRGPSRKRGLNERISKVGGGRWEDPALRE